MAETKQNKTTKPFHTLNDINSPSDLKRFSRKELEALAELIRKRIVEVVSKTGGHLASNLGVVELAIALHYVFNAPSDKIVWDVGHQAYAHKLLTGRNKGFDTLRQMGGISGFTRMSESPYDAFTTGHSSTAISAGLGMACALDLQKKRSKVLAVIGDGSMTAGLAYEGLNQAGDLQKDLIVILNDNDMSISRNVGALSSFLSRTLSARYLQDMRKEFGELLKSLPKIGDDMYQLAKRTEDSFKTFVTPGMIFEAFNFDYFGPIDGHNLNHLIDILQNIQSLNESVLLHVTTRKGKGYKPAEKNPVYFHGVGCFEVKTGNSVSNAKCAPTYTQVFGETLVELAKNDERIVAVTAAMPEGTGLVEFSKAFPDRFFDVGIAEQHGVTFAAGMAAQGLRPVVAIYSTFLQRAFDQILHDVSIESLPVIFAVDRGGIVGDDGPTHHGLFDLSYLRSIPNMTVMAPRDENELVQMLVFALSLDSPSAIRYPRGPGTGLPSPPNPAPVVKGKAEILSRGGDVLIMALGRPVIDALDACEELKKTGIHPTLVNCRFVKPLDSKLIIELAAQIPKMIIVEENIRAGGFSSAVLECLSDNKIHGVETVRLGVDDKFVEHGDPAVLRSHLGIDSKGIQRAVEELIREK